MALFLLFYPVDKADAVIRRNARLWGFLFKYKNVVNVIWAPAPWGVYAGSPSFFVNEFL